MDIQHPITETDIANFLANTPDFFTRHAEVLASVQLSSPHGNRAVSLQERQAQMLREKIKSLEHRAMDMMRHAGDNMLIADKLQRWTLGLLRTTESSALPTVVTQELQSQFSIPQVALRLWGVDQAHAGAAFTADVSEDVKTFVTSLPMPYVGVNAGFEAVQWLEQPDQAESLALIPLRLPNAGAQAFGLIVFASPDAYRFHAGMGTDFLERIADLSSAALSRLLPA
jgi:uncharacterized protein YigA (DUF484 family)